MGTHQSRLFGFGPIRQLLAEGSDFRPSRVDHCKGGEQLLVSVLGEERCCAVQRLHGTALIGHLLLQLLEWMARIAPCIEYNFNGQQE